MLIKKAFFMNDGLTILSFGAGQDSTAILYKIIHDLSFRDKYVKGSFIVVMSDTGNEHDETNIHVDFVKRLCYENHIYFRFIKADEGYHSGEWSKGLVGFYESNDRIGSKCFPKTCTDKLKISPIYNFLDDFININYNYGRIGKDLKLRKSAIKEFSLHRGKIRVLLGIAAKEERRLGDSESGPKWFRDSILKIYPLINEGWDRQACQDIITSYGYEVPLPSNCIICPFMSLQELLYLYLSNNHWFKKWVQLERNKLIRFSYNGDITKTLNSKGIIVDNMGVWGKKTLPEVLLEAKEKFGHMSIDELRDYKMSHGHCVKSKY